MTELQKESISKRMKGNQYRVGKTQSWSARTKIKQANKSLKWWNNGEKEVRAIDCPPGFIKGRLSNKGKVWVNDGLFEKQIKVEEINEFQKLGRLSSIKGYKWFSTAVENFRRREQDVDPDLIKIHRYYYGMVPTAFKTGQAYRITHPTWDAKHPSTVRFH